MEKGLSGLTEQRGLRNPDLDLLDPRGLRGGGRVANPRPGGCGDIAQGESRNARLEADVDQHLLAGKSYQIGPFLRVTSVAMVASGPARPATISILTEAIRAGSAVGAPSLSR